MPLIKNTVVLNTSPIIYLSSLSEINILEKLFGEVLIPEAVKQEVISGGEKSFGFKEVNEQWIKIRKIKSESAKKYLLTDLDEGEAEVIVLAEDEKADIIIMDDKLGRKVARLKGYNVMGTLRLLVIAKEKGIIPDVKSRIEKLKAAGFWLSEDITKVLLEQVGEL